MKQYTLFFLFILGIILSSSSNTLGSNKYQKHYLNKNHELDKCAINRESSSSAALKWFIKAYNDSSESPCFGWTGGNYGLVITDKKMYVYNHGSIVCKNLDYCSPDEKFKGGIGGMYFCLFWTDKNIYIFSDWKDSLIIKAYTDSTEYPIQGYVNDDQAMVLTNKRIYICLPDLEFWVEYSYELTEESSVGGALSSENALIWTDHGIYFSYWYGSIWNITEYEDPAEKPIIGGISTELAYVATDKRIYTFLCNGPLEPFTYAYLDSSEVPDGGGVSNIFVIVWTNKRINVFRIDIGFEWKVISYIDSSEIAKGGGANDYLAHVRTDQRMYILPQFAQDWVIQEYGADESYKGGYMTYNLATAWTDKKIYLYYDLDPNFIIMPFGDGEIPEEREGNYWLANQASVQTNKNIYIYDTFIPDWIISSYINYEERTKGSISRNVLALALTDRGGYIYDALGKNWSVQEFDCTERIVFKILGDLSALVVTDQGLYIYFQDQEWSNQPFIDNRELPIGGAVSHNFALSWTDKRIYVSDGSFVNISVPQTNINQPNEYILYQNYPNPFNSSTTIMFDVKGQSHVVLKIYNLAGQEIVTLLNEKMKAGHHKIMFDASKFSSGLYFYLIEMEGFKEYKKMLLIH